MPAQQTVVLIDFLSPDRISPVEKTTQISKILKSKDWFKSYGDVKWCIPNGWMSPGDDAPSFV